MWRKKDLTKVDLDAYDLTPDNLKMLANFVEILKFNYNLLKVPELEFFRDWLVDDLNAKIPEAESRPNGDAPRQYVPPGAEEMPWRKDFKRSNDEPEEPAKDEEDDNDIEMEGVDTGGTDTPQEMGDDEKEPTDAEREEATGMRELGMDALNNGDYEGAVKHFTAGILLDNSKTVLFIKRATAFLRLSKPKACMRDAEKALSINPDSAPAFKILGKAEKLLGNWEQSCHHFEEAQKIDYDPDVAELLKEIKPQANKIREQKIAKERELKEKEIAEKLRRVTEAKEAREKARKEQEQRDKEAEEKFRQEMPGMFNFAGEANMPGASAPADEPEAEEDAGPKIFEVPDDIDLD